MQKNSVSLQHKPTTNFLFTMKRFIILLSAILFIVVDCQAQLVYKGYLTFRRDRYSGFSTTWGGWAHYWGPNNTTGIKMHIHASDPRMSSTTSQIVFLDSDREMYIDLCCRNLYQTSDENLKTDIKPLKNLWGKNSATMIVNVNATNNRTDDVLTLVSKLNPVAFHWRDEIEYEKNKIRPVKEGVEEYGFIAQELENIIPGAVALTDNGDRLVNYSALIPILTGAIQELNEKVAELECQISILTAK